jgi:hypothetical protein
VCRDEVRDMTKHLYKTIDALQKQSSPFRGKAQWKISLRALFTREIDKKGHGDLQKSIFSRY